jgi:hypothetical protein
MESHMIEQEEFSIDQESPDKNESVITILIDAIPLSEEEKPVKQFNVNKLWAVICISGSALIMFGLITLIAHCMD